MTEDTERSQLTTKRVNQRLASILRHDVPASLVVFLVAVPLSLGIAVASGAPLIAGLVAAVVGGLVAGALGGSPLQVSGPAAGLSLVVAELVQSYGWRATCMITLLAGLLQLVLGMFRVSRAALAISPAVIHGMLAGVGVVIALAQLHIVLGGKSQGSALENIVELPAQIINNHGHAVAAGVLTITVLAVWPRLPHLRTVPAPLAALLIAGVTASGLGWDVTHIDLTNLTGGAAWWTLPIWPQGDWHAIIGAVLLVAILAAVESLLCAVATERMHHGTRGDLDRELTGQGIANVVSGILGGLPVAGVIVRSTTNVRAGARSRWSTMLHGLWMLAFTIAFGWTIRLIPVEALAALLMYTGLRMVDLAHVRSLRGHGEAPVYAVALCGVVVLGLAEGVLIGLGLAALLALRRLTHVSIHLAREDDGHWHLAVTGSLTFLGVPRLTDNLRAVPAGAVVDLELNVDFMDHAAFEALHAWRLEHERGGGQVEIDEVHDEWYTAAANGSRMFPVKSPPRAPDHWWLPWAYRRRGRTGAPAHHPRSTFPSSSRGPASHSAQSQAETHGEPDSHGMLAAPTEERAAHDQPGGHTEHAPAHIRHPGHSGHSTHIGHSPTHAEHCPAHTGHCPAHTGHGAAPAGHGAYGVRAVHDVHAVPRLLAGTSEFHRKTAPLIRPILTRMARGQSPSHLFITCADSRIVPNLITASGPGDLFTVRNIGNFVPRYQSSPQDDSVAAAIEYATETLGVRTIIVCGHSGCGAMSALLSEDVDADTTPGLRRWLRHGRLSLAGFVAAPPDTEGPGPLDRLCRINVLQQLDNLLTYPPVAKAVRAGHLELVGLYFDIASARVHILDRESFAPLPDLRTG